jgi:hypothetical protein
MESLIRAEVFSVMLFGFFGVGPSHDFRGQTPLSPISLKQALSRRKRCRSTNINVKLAVTALKD